MNPAQFLRNFKTDFIRGVDAQDLINISKDKYRYTVLDPQVAKAASKGYEGTSAADFVSKATGQAYAVGDPVKVPKAQNLAEYLGRYSAQLATDILSDGTRQFYWRYNHPLAIGQKVIETNVPGLRSLKSPLDKAILGGAIGAPVASSLGIFDVTNPGELFRPKGYAQSFAEKGSDDRRKTAEPGMEIFERFFLGRRGRPLKYETAKQDIPSLTPQRYGKAMRSQYQDRGVLGMGLLKGTTENLEGYPEIRVVGFPVGLQAAGALAGGIAGSKTAGKLGLVSPVASRKSIIKAAGVTLAGSLGGAATGKTLNMTIASANRPKYLTTADYMQG
tara:strand:+ start:1346 stop:2341 length:996 start_codon:yes stop_codon:yes gene_type:complete